MAIDKITAGILYGYGYKLLRVETGQMFEITGIDLSSITKQIFLKLSIDGKYWGAIRVPEIGTTYKILARPLEMLTKEIEGKVPLIECVKIIESPFSGGKVIKLESTFRGEKDAVVEKGWFCTVEYLYNSRTIYSLSYSEYFKRFIVRNETLEKPLGVPYQLSLFQYLYSLNFNIGFPENTTTDLI